MLLVSGSALPRTRRPVNVPVSSIPFSSATASMDRRRRLWASRQRLAVGSKSPARAVACRAIAGVRPPVGLTLGSLPSSRPVKGGRGR